jgi:hypothetical protein
LIKILKLNKMKAIPYGRQDINQNDIDVVIETLKSDYLTQGPKLRSLKISLLIMLVLNMLLL